MLDYYFLFFIFWFHFVDFFFLFIPKWESTNWFTVVCIYRFVQKKVDTVWKYDLCKNKTFPMVIFFLLCCMI